LEAPLCEILNTPLELSQHEYDWRLRLSHINMTDSDLTKYD